MSSLIEAFHSDKNSGMREVFVYLFRELFPVRPVFTDAEIHKSGNEDDISVLYVIEGMYCPGAGH